MQLSLFDQVKSAFTQASGPITNEELYQAVARKAGLSDDELSEKVPIGKSGQPVNLVKRRLRWHQQTLKQQGIIARTGRGRWELTKKGKIELRKIQPRSTMVAFSTELGAALWSLSDDVFDALDAPITLALTSPPYPLARSRAYGNPSVNEYIEFVVESLRPIAANLERGGSICLNVSNDIFEPGSPARSIYREKLVIAIVEELGLWKMDELPWINRCKPPGPVRYASIERNQLNVTWEPVYWFAKDPAHVKADNRRVLLPHTEQHRRYMESGGARSAVVHSDGAYRTRAGAYSNPTPGRIPRNVLDFTHNCPSQQLYKRHARELGLAPHGAPFPLVLATFLIRFLSEPGDLVVDPFAGSCTVGVGAEQEGRRWLLTECMWDYLRPVVARFRPDADFTWNSEFLEVA